MLHVQQSNHFLTPAPKSALSTSIKSNITISQLVASTSLVTIPTPKSKKLKIYPLQKMSSNAQRHLPEEFVLNNLIPNPSTTIFSMIPKKSMSTLARPTPIQLITPPILVKLSLQIKVPEATDAEKDVAKKNPKIQPQFPHHNLKTNATIVNASPNSLTPTNPTLQFDRRRTKLVPAVKFTVHNDSLISPL